MNTFYQMIRATVILLVFFYATTMVGSFFDALSKRGAGSPLFTQAGLSDRVSGERQADDAAGLGPVSGGLAGHRVSAR